MRISDWSSDVCSSDLRCSCCRGVQLCCDIRGMREEVRMLRYYKSALFAGVSLLTTVPVMAQDVAPAPAAAEEEMAVDSGEIVVTARRREERLQDVPVSVTAFSSEALQRSNISTAADLRSEEHTSEL